MENFNVFRRGLDTTCNWSLFFKCKLNVYPLRHNTFNSYEVTTNKVFGTPHALQLQVLVGLKWQLCGQGRKATQLCSSHSREECGALTATEWKSGSSWNHTENSGYLRLPLNRYTCKTGWKTKRYSCRRQAESVELNLSARDVWTSHSHNMT